MPKTKPAPKPRLDLNTIVVGVVAAVLGGGSGFLGANQQASSRSDKQELRLMQRLDYIESNQRKIVNILNGKTDIVLDGPPAPSIYE